MSTRPRKVEVIVLGRGVAAVALAEALLRRERRVALLAESPGWERGTRPAWQGWHRGEQTTASLAAEGVARLGQWAEEGVPGIAAHDDGEGGRLWLLDYDRLLPALASRIEAAERSWVARDTRVRGLSVIEKRFLGAIAEDSRYDARLAVNAAEDERFAAFARMMQQRDALDLHVVTPPSLPSPRLAGEDVAGWPSAEPFARDRSPPAYGETAVEGAWCLRGVAGWPLLAIGAAVRVAAALAPDLRRSSPPPARG